MNPYSRRQFLQTSSVFVAGTLVAPSFSLKKDKPLLSFSTLGCPDWSFDQIVNFAFMIVLWYGVGDVGYHYSLASFDAAHVLRHKGGLLLCVMS